MLRADLNGVECRRVESDEHSRFGWSWEETVLRSVAVGSIM